MPFPKSFTQSGVRCDISPRAQELWNPAIQAAVENTESTITVYGIIGEDWYGDGVTLKRIDAALRSIGNDNDVTVYINSPGGDMFEGIAIYNRFLEHKGKVTTKVLGLAASAASVIYMAGADDARFIASSAFLMIHNCWVYTVGNRHALRNVADDMEEFDAAMVDLYVDGSDQSEKAITKMMDEETFIRGKKAVELGFASGTLSTDEIGESTDNANANSLRKVDAAMAKAGVPRSERRQLLQDLKSSTPSAVGGIKPGADVSDTQNAVAPDLSALISASKTILIK